jgi:hypothetical protein
MCPAASLLLLDISYMDYIVLMKVMHAISPWSGMAGTCFITHAVIVDVEI